MRTASATVTLRIVLRAAAFGSRFQAAFQASLFRPVPVMKVEPMLVFVAVSQFAHDAGSLALGFFPPPEKACPVQSAEFASPDR